MMLIMLSTSKAVWYAMMDPTHTFSLQVVLAMPALATEHLGKCVVYYVVMRYICLNNLPRNFV